MKIDMYTMWIVTFAVPGVIAGGAFIRYCFWFAFGV